MKYIYYRGCSLEGTAREYDIATCAMLEALGVELVEIDDWTCCGATAAGATSRLLALALPARNLALAQRMAVQCDVLAPCSACYLNLKAVEIKSASDPACLNEINTVLAEEGLALGRGAKVRHLLDVLVNDVTPRQIAAAVVRPLAGMRIAPYYGCQCLRPYAVFDHPEAPRSMEGLIRAAGAEVYDWSMGAKCCGASHMNTKQAVGLELCGAILEAAQTADAIATVCPMCHLNLEAYQAKLSRDRQTSLHTSIVYLPQLLGIAMALPQKSVCLNQNLAVTQDFSAKLARLPLVDGRIGKAVSMQTT